MKERLRKLPFYGVGKWIYRRIRKSDPTAQERILKAVRGKSTVFFVQVGSNDGVRGDPLHELIVNQPSWSGIFVEPVNFLYQKLRQNYGDEERFTFENVAIGTEKGRKKFYYISAKAPHELDLPAWHDGLGSFDKTHITSGLGDRITPYIVEEDIECVPLQEVLDRNGVAEIDLFHVDTEGFDYKVLSQIDFTRYKPSAIMFEHCVLTDEEFDKACKLLRRTGYRLHHYDGDILAVRKSSWI
jgi:FkbM family methyltransferase